MRVFDLHCDTIMEIYRNDKKLDNNDLHIDLNKLKLGNYLVQCFAMFVPSVLKDSFSVCNEMIDKLEMEAKRCGIDILYDNKVKGLSGILTIEDAGCLNGSIEKLHHFYKRGVKMIGLTWNFVNEVGYPNFVLKKDETPDFKTPDVLNGLTECGIDIVKEMDRLGMLVDVSHLSDKGFYDVASIVKGPFVASHSNCRSICPHVRNLTDDMIRVLSSHGGIMGINYCTDFVNENEKETKISDLVKHIRHAVEIGGIDCVALGSDFDGIPHTLEMKDSSELDKLYNALKPYFTDEEIEKIFYKNALRVFKLEFID